MAKQMTHCCCGCSLRTGTLLIAMVGIFGSVTAILNGFYGPELVRKPWSSNIDTNNTTLSPDTNTNMEDNTTEFSNVSQEVSKNTTQEDTKNATTVVVGKPRFRLSYQGVVGFMELGLSMVLIMGTLQAKPRLVYPWIAMNIIFCIISAIVNIILTIFVIELHGFFAGLICFVVICVGATLQIYALTVVNSFYNTLLLISPIDSFA